MSFRPGFEARTGGASGSDPESDEPTQNQQEREAARRIREELSRVRRRGPLPDRSGIDTGEPISGMNSPGDPRTSPDDPQPAEGPGEVTPAEDGMGGSMTATSGPVSASDQEVTNTAGQTVDPVPDRYDPSQTDQTQSGSEPTPSVDGDRSEAPATDSGSVTGGGLLGSGATSGAADATPADIGGGIGDGQPSGDVSTGEVGSGPAPSEPDIRGGLEESATGQLRETALDLEQEALDQLGLQSAGAVNIVRDGAQLRAELTSLGEDRLEEQAADSLTSQYGQSRAERTADRARESGATDEQAAAVERSLRDLGAGGGTLDINLTGDDVDRETRVTDPAGVGGAAATSTGVGVAPAGGLALPETETVFALTDSGEAKVTEAQRERAADLLDIQTPTETTPDDLVRTEQGGFQLDQEARNEIEALQERRQQAGDALQNYRTQREVAADQQLDSPFEASDGPRVNRTESTDDDSPFMVNQSGVPKGFGGEVLGNPRISQLRSEAADAYSEQLGFDVPASAVDVSEEQQDGETVLSPSLDIEAAKAAGRRQPDALSGIVGASEYLIEKWTPAEIGKREGGVGERNQTDALSPAVGATEFLIEKWTPLELDETGSVTNVREVEDFANENEVTGEVDETTIAGVDLGQAQDIVQGLSRGYSERVSQPIGDLAAFIAREQRSDVTGRSQLLRSLAAKEFYEGDIGAGFEALGGDTAATSPTPAENLISGTTSGVAEFANIPGFAELGLTAADVGLTGAERIGQGEGDAFSAGVEDAAVSVAEQNTETFVENPAQTTGMVIGGVASGAGVGAAGKRAFTATRGRLATRGLDFQGDVPRTDIERPDVRSGQSQLTRFSEEAVPGGDKSMRVEDFPATPASDTAQELRNLAREFDNPEIRRALDAEADESVLFSARTGVKGDRFEPRSGRDYDPDASFYSGSVATNFLKLNKASESSLGGGLRLPRPIAAARSLTQAARQEGTPVIVGTAGRVRMFPKDIVSARGDRRAMTEFLEEQANTGEFYTLRPEAESGEAEALTAASGASKTDPKPGAGLIDEGDATEFVEVARPFRTEIRGERVPIQLYRQNTDDVTPLSEQSTVPDRLRMGIQGDRGQLDLTGSRRSTVPDRLRRTSVRPDRSDSGEVAYRLGGEPGIPVAPVLPWSASAEPTGSSTEDRIQMQPSGTPISSVVSPEGSSSVFGLTSSQPDAPGDPSDSVVYIQDTPGSLLGPSSTPPGPPSTPPSIPPGPPSTPPGTPSTPPGPPSTPPGTPDIPPGTPTIPPDPPDIPPWTPGIPPGTPDKPPRRFDFDIDIDADEQTSGFVATAEEQQFVNPIADVEDILGI